MASAFDDEYGRAARFRLLELFRHTGTDNKRTHDARLFGLVALLVRRDCRYGHCAWRLRSDLYLFVTLPEHTDT